MQTETQHHDTRFFFFFFLSGKECTLPTFPQMPKTATSYYMFTECKL